MPQPFDLNPEEAVVRGYLKQALNDSGPSIERLRLMQRFAAETPHLFLNAALSLLDADEDSDAHRFMVVKLLGQPQLMGVLSDPERLDRQRAIRLFRRLMRHDRALDVRLAQTLPGRYDPAGKLLNVPACGRALDVLDQVSAGRRIVPIVGHLVDHPVSWISAKATLVVGKRVLSIAWVQRMLLSNRSPRDRANAVQTLWGMNSPAARELLWEHSRDNNNRVAGNALLGLHTAGDLNSLVTIDQMAQHLEPEFRWTAAWLMGTIRTEQHAARLKLMMKDDNSGVRRAVLKALVGIRQHKQPVPAAEPIAELPVVELLMPPAEPELIAMPDFNLRLDGQSFSFRDAS